MAGEVSRAGQTTVTITKWKKGSKGNTCIWNALKNAGYSAKEIKEKNLVAKTAKDNNIENPNLVKPGQKLKITPKKAQESGKTSAPSKAEMKKLDDFKKENNKKPDSNVVRSQSFSKVQKNVSKKVTGDKVSQKKEIKKKDEAGDKKKTEQQKKPKYDPSSDVKVLNKAMDGWGTDEDAIFNVLKGKSPEERKALKDAYKKKYGKDLEGEIKDEMSGGDWNKAKALLDSGKLKDADELRQAMAGAGTDEKAIHRVLDGKSPKEIDSIKKEYKQRYGKDLDKDLKSEMSGYDLKKSKLLMKGEPQENKEIKDPKERKADLVKRKGLFEAEKLAMDMGEIKRGGSNEATRSLLDDLHGKSPEERKAIRDAYKQQTGKDLEGDIKRNLRGSDRSMAMSYLKNGKETDAEKLNRAVKGLGTDEKLIFRTLEGKSPEERKAMAKEYKEKYGEDLSDALKGDLGGSDWTKAKALMDNGKLSVSDKLNMTMDDMGTDEKGIFDTLKNATPEERKEIQKNKDHWKKRFDSELSGEDYERAMQLLDSKDGKLSTEANIKIAMAGLGTDEKAIFQALEKATPEERKAIMKNPALMKELDSELNKRDLNNVNTVLKDGKLPAKEKLSYAMSGLGTDEEWVFDAMKTATPEERKAMMNDSKLKWRLQDELSGTDLEKANLLMKQGKLTTDQKLDLSMKGAGTDEKGVYDAIKDATPEERKRLLRDKKFMDRLDGEMDGAEFEKAKILLEKGKTTSIEDLHLAMKGAGTDEDAIFATLGNCKNDKEKQALIDGYRKKYGSDLLSDLKGDLSTSEYNRAYDMLLQEPKTLEERKEQMEHKLARQRDGRSGWTAISNGIMDDFSDSGRNLDDSARELRLIHKDMGKREKAGGEVDDATLKKLDRAEKGVNNSIQDYQEAKDKVADGLTTAASVTAAVVVTVGTAGAGASVAVPWLVGSTLACGTSKVLINKAVKGDSYDALGSDGFKDFSKGAVEGALNVAGGAAGSKIAGSMFSKGGRPLMERLVTTGLTDGISTGAGSGFNTAVEEKTWKDGFGKGLLRVGGETALGTGLGFAVGGAFDGITTGLPGMMGLKMGGSYTNLSEGIGKGAARKAGQKGGQKIINALESSAYGGLKKATTAQPKSEVGNSIHDGILDDE